MGLRGEALVAKKARDALRDKASKRYQPRKLVMGDGTFRLAEQGERGGDLWDVWSVNLASMQEFGLGIGTYFAVNAGYALIFAALATLFAGSYGALAPCTLLFLGSPCL